MVSTLKWVTVSIQDVVNNDYRLEASCYNIESIKATENLSHLSIPLKPLYGSNGIAEVFNLLRFKRVFVEKSELPIFQPSQITDIYPKPQLFISAKTKTNINSLRVSKGQLLMTCSGTIGKCSMVWDRLNNSIFSHDLLRINCKTDYDTAFTYAYIRTDIGQTLLSAKPYGAVIQHIEPEHLKDYLIPYPEESVRKEIGNKVLKSFELRDKSNDLIDEAEEALVKALGLPVIERINLGKYDNSLSAKNFSVSSTELNERFDASYHDPLMSVVINLTQKAGAEVIALGDRRLSKSIVLPGRFKRVYVDKGNGTVFLGGKQIYELDPHNKKYLSVKTHGDRIDNQLLIHKNMIAITRSGTIGRVNLVPKHMENWIYSEHIIRVIPATSDIAGYLYIWLNTDYGRAMIERYSYGAVIKEIDHKQLATMPIPVINDKQKTKKINDLAIEANRLRSEAYYLEQEAIEDVNNLMSLNTMEE